MSPQLGAHRPSRKREGPPQGAGLLQKFRRNISIATVAESSQNHQDVVDTDHTIVVGVPRAIAGYTSVVGQDDQQVIDVYSAILIEVRKALIREDQSQFTGNGTGAFRRAVQDVSIKRHRARCGHLCDQHLAVGVGVCRGLSVWRDEPTSAILSSRYQIAACLKGEQVQSNGLGLGS